MAQERRRQIERQVAWEMWTELEENGRNQRRATAEDDGNLISNSKSVNDKNGMLETLLVALVAVCRIDWEVVNLSDR